MRLTDKQQIWKSKKYYQKAQEASLNLSYPAYAAIKQYFKKAKTILEVGCGEGTKLANFTTGGKKSYGVDISEKAIKLAQKQYPYINFQLADAAKLPFEKSFFDLVFCAFMLEHTKNPEEIINEMIRVLKAKGKLIILSPNYGAPNRASPCFKGSRTKKLIISFIKDLINLFFGNKSLGWRRVEPKSNNKSYEVDWDTTVEPYLGSLADFIKNKNLNIVKQTSFWGEIKEDLKPWQKIFKFFGGLKAYPFVNWGPHFLLVAQKG